MSWKTIKINSKFTRNLTVKGKTNPLEKQDLGIGKDFSNRAQKTLTVRGKESIYTHKDIAQV